MAKHLFLFSLRWGHNCRASGWNGVWRMAVLGLRWGGYLDPSGTPDRTKLENWMATCETYCAKRACTWIPNIFTCVLQLSTNWYYCPETTTPLLYSSFYHPQVLDLNPSPPSLAWSYKEKKRKEKKSRNKINIFTTLLTKRSKI